MQPELAAQELDEHPALRSIASTPNLAAGGGRQGMRRVCSVPAALSTGQPVIAEGEDAGMEVYVALRPLREFGGVMFNSLPLKVKEGLRDVGICHYMTVFKSQATGECFQFDFGPIGGDVAKAGSRVARSARMLAFQDPGLEDVVAGRGRAKGVRGEIREEKLPEGLPEDSMLIGRTRVTMEEIRSFNSVQPQTYELHNNDCRHYVNKLVTFTTGFEKASTVLTRHALRARKEGKLSWNQCLLAAGQHVTDVHNWGVVSTVRNAAVGAVATATGARIVPRGLVSSKVIPAAVRVTSKFVPPSAVAAFATVAASCGESKLVRDSIATGMRLSDGFRSSIGFAENAMCATASATAQTAAFTARWSSSAVKATTSGVTGLVMTPFNGLRGMPRSTVKLAASSGNRVLHRLSVARTYTGAAKPVGVPGKSSVVLKPSFNN